MGLYEIITKILGLLGPWAGIVLLFLFAAAAFGSYRLSQFILAEDPWRSFWGVVLSLVLVPILMAIFLLFFALMATLAPWFIKVGLGILRAFSEIKIDPATVEPVKLW